MVRATDKVGVFPHESLQRAPMLMVSLEGLCVLLKRTQKIEDLGTCQSIVFR